MIGLIGCTGMIGKLLQQTMSFDHLFDSHNISTLLDYKFDILYCAAPSSNRLIANSNPVEDLDNIKILAKYLTLVTANKIVLISTVDTQVKTTCYATNRKYLEQQIQTRTDYNIVRLCSLIGPSIKKNLLYDLKNNQYTESINLLDVCQWYPLEHLSQDISQLISDGSSIVNLVSEPIVNNEIVKLFAPEKITLMQNRQENYYNIQPYCYTKQQVLATMEKYFVN
jgi:hypothetical protein